MFYARLMVVFMLMLSCKNDRRKESIDKGIRMKESGKSTQYDSYRILSSHDTLGILTVVYSATITSGGTQHEIKDSVIFYELPDGNLEPQR